MRTIRTIRFYVHCLGSHCELHPEYPEDNEVQVENSLSQTLRELPFLAFPGKVKITFCPPDNVFTLEIPISYFVPPDGSQSSELEFEWLMAKALFEFCPQVAFVETPGC